MAEQKTRAEILRALFDKYNLVYDTENPESKDNDVYRHKHYTIITRSGIQKIERIGNWKTVIDVVGHGPEYCYVSGRIYPGDATDPLTPPMYQTLASASDATSQNKYYAEMAEKRCRSRLILTVAGLYELGGIYSEDEADDFSKSQPPAQAEKRVVIKG